MTPEQAEWLPDRCAFCGHVLATGEMVYADGTGIRARLDATERALAEAEQREAALVGLLETQTMFACRKGDEAITPVACDTHYSAWQPWGECYYVEQIHIALAASRAARGPRP